MPESRSTVPFRYLLFAMIWLPGRAVAGDDSLEAICAAHQASRQAINSLACKVEMTQNRLARPPATIKMLGNYFRSLEVFRLSQTADNGAEDIVFENGVAR